MEQPTRMRQYSRFAAHYFQGVGCELVLASMDTSNDQRLCPASDYEPRSEVAVHMYMYRTNIFSGGMKERLTDKTVYHKSRAKLTLSTKMDIKNPLIEGYIHRLHRLV